MKNIFFITFVLLYLVGCSKAPEPVAQSNSAEILPMSANVEEIGLVKEEIIAEGYTFGYALFNIDLSSYQEKQIQTTYTILSIFPFALIFGLVLSLFLSRNYTKPFITLINAMKKSDPTNDKIIKVETTANNEIKELFEGFNKQMNQIACSSKELHFQATHDKLTNIFNRFYMENSLNDSLKQDNKNGYNLLYLDIDQF